MVDVVPGLNADIKTAFQSRMNRDRRVSSVSRRIKGGLATLDDGHLYATAVGENMSGALRAVLTPSRLPDEKLYRNIAQRTVKPALKEAYALVNDTAATIQKTVDKKNGVRLNAIKADFDDERVDNLIDKMTEDLEDIEGALNWLKEPIVNNAESFFDDFVNDNADFRERSGLQAKITRTAESDCCPWCAEKEGTWDYGDEPDDVYQRHEFCRCSVTYTSEKVAQNVWTKQKWQPSKEDYDRMRSAASNAPRIMSLEERKQVIESIRRDREVKQSGLLKYGRAYARERTRILAQRHGNG